ncbi:MAG: nickel pincer cofactor biosynthesis protein LarC [Verrucomicrobia bacterium]|nr:MAG: nickel pincer cofactor biosynthesis protein LarC [Verrucomicrobiota bacterium]
MKILHFQGIGGASGDMMLAALVDLGVDARKIQHQLATLHLAPFKLLARTFGSHGLHGAQIEVKLSAISHQRSAGHTEHRHHGRSFRAIRRLIECSRLPEVVRVESVAVFQKLAEAEAKMHAVPVDDVHFHEIGAVDSIVDIVGACLAKHELGVVQVVVDPLPLGSGTVHCAHGVYPVPAPATLELLRDFPIAPNDESGELVTPTGAALLMAWRNLDRAPAGCRIIKSGHGFGHRQLEHRPNLLRAILLETNQAATVTDEGHVLECNLDDTTPELIGALTTQLLAAGALDVWSTAIQMKKQRPGVLLSVLCHVPEKPVLLDLIFRGSTTFGVREYAVQRTLLARRLETVTTPFGAVRVKIGAWRGSDVTRAPEMDDCIALAQKNDVSVRAVYEAACRFPSLGKKKQPIFQGLEKRVRRKAK